MKPPTRRFVPAGTLVTTTVGRALGMTLMVIMAETASGLPSVSFPLATKVCGPTVRLETATENGSTLSDPYSVPSRKTMALVTKVLAETLTVAVSPARNCWLFVGLVMAKVGRVANSPQSMKSKLRSDDVMLF